MVNSTPGFLALNAFSTASVPARSVATAATRRVSEPPEAPVPLLHALMTSAPAARVAVSWWMGRMDSSSEGGQRRGGAALKW